MKNNKFIKNCCDGLYNSIDVHFTGLCDNKCKHCIDTHYLGIGVNKPDIDKIANTIIENQNKYDDILFLGGEPCLYLDDLIKCIEKIKSKTKLKIFVTTAIPEICYEKYDLFIYLTNIINGINFSVQHYKENIADEIRQTNSNFDRQKFYSSIPNKEKIRINLNILKPFLYTKNEIINCIKHYDSIGFKEIKLSEIQHGEKHFISFEKIFNLKLQSPFYSGCQTLLNNNEIFPNIKAKIILKRSCFLCEKTLKASFKDFIKVCYKIFNNYDKDNYGVIYEDGTLTKGWV